MRFSTCITLITALAILTDCGGGASAPTAPVPAAPAAPQQNQPATQQSVINPIPAGSGPNVTIKEFFDPQFPSFDASIAVASDGAVWWKSAGTGQQPQDMVRMSGSTVTAIPFSDSEGTFVPQTGATFAATPNGRVWTFGTLSGMSSSVQFFYASAGQPQALLGGDFFDEFLQQKVGIPHIGPDGNMWFVASQQGFTPWTLCVKQTQDMCANDTFGYVPQNATAKTPTVTFTSATPGTQEVLYAIITGPDKNVWVGGILPPGTLYGFHRYTTSGTLLGNVFSTVPVPSGSMADAVTGADGNVWFTDPNQNAVVRLTPTGGTTIFTLPTANANPFAITRGGDGAVWFTEENANKVGRISASGVISEYTLPTQQSSKPGQIVGPESVGCPTTDLWVSQPGTGQIAHLIITP